MKIRYIVVLGLIITLVSFSACKKEDLRQYKKPVSIEITDAPIDDNNVIAVYVTISAIMLDGSPIESFKKVTVNLKSLQNGKTKLLTNTDLDLSNHKSITLILDYDKDNNGEYPGAYVLDDIGKKHPLKTDDNALTLNYDYSVSNANHLLIDFDLRKAIVRVENENDKYDFPNHDQLISAIKLADKDKLGTLKGNARNLTDNKGRTVVYIYKAGSYDAIDELNLNGTKIEFANAVSSAIVSGNGDYKINFLTEGNYIIEFAFYNKDKSGKIYEFQGIYQQSSLTYLPDGVIKITSNNVTNIDLFLTGLKLI